MTATFRPESRENNEIDLTVNALDTLGDEIDLTVFVATITELYVPPHLGCVNISKRPFATIGRLLLLSGERGGGIAALVSVV
jgi:hypothetical protein